MLVADDSSIWRAFLVRSLTDAGATVVGVATDGVDAVDQADRVKPDVIVMDIGLPHLSTLEAADFIREVVAPDMQFVFVGRPTDPEFIAAALTEFGGSYVCKTSNGAEVTAQLTRSLQKSHVFV